MMLDPKNNNTGSGAIASQGGVAAGAGGVAVGGNVAGSVIVENKVINHNTIYGNVVNNLSETAPSPTLRDALPPPPRAPQDFFDRTDELGQIEQAIGASQSLTIYGHDGAGKSTLLWQAANSSAARALPHGVVLVRGIDAEGQALSLSDVVQQLFEQLYQSPVTFKVDEATARPYLGITRPLVLLDNVNLPNRDQYGALFDLFPHSPILLAQPHALSGLTRTVKLGPLPRADAVDLFVVTSGLRAGEANRATLDAICDQLADVPLAIVRAADVLREENLTLDQVHERLAAAPAVPGDPIDGGLARAYALAASILSDLERHILTVVANLPGDSVDPDLIVKTLGSDALEDTAARPAVARVSAGIDHLKALGLLHTTSPRVRIDAGLRDLLHTRAAEAAAYNRLLAQLLSDAASGRFLDDEYCEEELGHILGAIDWAARRNREREAITLCRAIDRYLTLHGLWGAWGRVLDLGLAAARSASGSRRSDLRSGSAETAAPVRRGRAAPAWHGSASGSA